VDFNKLPKKEKNASDMNSGKDNKDLIKAVPDPDREGRERKLQRGSI
jgi:hypothetical protein